MKENNFPIQDEKIIQTKFKYLQTKLADQFGADMDIVNILYLIGVQEAGEGFDKFTKDEKTELITIANNKVLSYFGYYKQSGIGLKNWPVYEQLKEISHLSQSEKDTLILNGIIYYFADIEYI
jgi:hypothetical protein